MTAPDPTPPPASTDPYVAARQRDVLVGASQPICACGHTHQYGQPCRLTGCSCRALHRTATTAAGILTMAEKPVDEQLAVIRREVEQITESGACSIADRVLARAFWRLLDVVEQVAGQVGT